MNKSEVITIRIDSKLMERIREESVKNYRTIAKHIAFIIDESFKKEGK
jgi:hypothetical protein